MAGYYSHIVGLHKKRFCGDVHREGLALEDVLRGPVACAEAQKDLMVIAYGSPCGVHCIDCAVIVVCADNQHGLWINKGLFAYVYSHSFLSII